MTGQLLPPASHTRISPPWAAENEASYPTSSYRLWRYHSSEFRLACSDTPAPSFVVPPSSGGWGDLSLEDLLNFRKSPRFLLNDAPEAACLPKDDRLCAFGNTSRAYPFMHLTHCTGTSGRHILDEGEDLRTLWNAVGAYAGQVNAYIPTQMRARFLPFVVVQGVNRHWAVITSREGASQYNIEASFRVVYGIHLRRLAWLLHARTIVLLELPHWERELRQVANTVFAVYPRLREVFGSTFSSQSLSQSVGCIFSQQSESRHVEVLLRCGTPTFELQLYSASQRTKPWVAVGCAAAYTEVHDEDICRIRLDSGWAEWWQGLGEKPYQWQRKRREDEVNLVQDVPPGAHGSHPEDDDTSALASRSVVSVQLPRLPISLPSERSVDACILRAHPTLPQRPQSGPTTHKTSPPAIGCHQTSRLGVHPATSVRLHPYLLPRQKSARPFQTRLPLEQFNSDHLCKQQPHPVTVSIGAKGGSVGEFGHFPYRPAPRSSPGSQVHLPVPPIRSIHVLPPSSSVHVVLPLPNHTQHDSPSLGSQASPFSKLSGADARALFAQRERQAALNRAEIRQLRSQLRQSEEDETQRLEAEASALMEQLEAVKKRPKRKRPPHRRKKGISAT